MGRRKKIKSLNPNASVFIKTDHYELPENNRVIEFDETIKIIGEHGKKFKFKSHVVRSDTGAEWIECIQLEKSVYAGWRFFRPERIKALPKTRRPRKAS